MVLPDIIEAAFRDLDEFLKGTNWHGRENEVVNLYAHRFLHEYIRPDSEFRSLRQIGIEVAVLQIANRRKKYVRKDLVIWPEDDMTVWSVGATPAAIIEWKRNRNCTALKSDESVRLDRWRR